MTVARSGSAGRHGSRLVVGTTHLAAAARAFHYSGWRPSSLQLRSRDARGRRGRGTTGADELDERPPMARVAKVRVARAGSNSARIRPFH